MKMWTSESLTLLTELNTVSSVSALVTRKREKKKGQADEDTQR